MGFFVGFLGGGGGGLFLQVSKINDRDDFVHHDRLTRTYYNTLQAAGLPLSLLKNIIKSKSCLQTVTVVETQNQ